MAISSQVLLDRERCVLCARCTRFSQQIAGDPFIELFERGALEQVAIYEDEPFESYFSGNTVQICPVGALTGAAYRFRARPFDLQSTPSACEHCASGCALRTDYRRGKVLRRLAGEDPEVNEEWNCDKGRWAFTYAHASRPAHHAAGATTRPASCVPTSWTEALERGGRGAARGPRQRRRRRAARRPAHRRGRLRLRQVRPRGARHQRHRLPGPPALRRGAGVPGRARRRGARRAGSPTPTSKPRRPCCWSASSRRRSRRSSSCGCARLRATTAPGCSRSPRSPPTACASSTAPCSATVPGDEAARSTRSADGSQTVADAAGAMRAARRGHPGRRAARRRAGCACPRRRGWPRRPARSWPGCRGARASAARSRPVRCRTCCPAVGWCPTRPRSRARARLALRAIARHAGRDTTGILIRRASGELSALLVGGVDPGDLPDPALAEAALDAAGFVVSLELRHSAVTERADVVLPVAPAVEKAGTFVDWEGRARPFDDGASGTRRARAMPASCTRSAERARASSWALPRVERGPRQWAAFGGATTIARPPDPRSRPQAAAEPGCRRGGAGDLALAARRRVAAGRRAAPGRHRQAPRCTCRRPPPPASVPLRASWSRSSTGRGSDHAAARASPTCPTAWSGCRPVTGLARPLATSASTHGVSRPHLPQEAPHETGCSPTTNT